MSFAPPDCQVPYNDLNSILMFIFLFADPPCRKSCLKASSYSTAAKPLTEGNPICMAPKSKHSRKLQNVFLDDQGFPDQSDDYDQLLHSIDGGPFCGSCAIRCLTSAVILIHALTIPLSQRSMKNSCKSRWTYHTSMSQGAKIKTPRESYLQCLDKEY